MRFSYTAVSLLLALALAAPAQDAQALLGAGLGQLRVSRYESAAEAFRSALKLDPALIIAQYDLGVCYFAEGQFDQARSAFQRTLILAPGHRFAVYYLARIDVVQNRAAAAIQRFESLSRGKPVADELYYLGSAYFHEGNIPDAIRTLKRAVEVNPADHRVHFLFARVYRKAGRDTDAEREFHLSAQIRKESQEKAREITNCETALGSLPSNQAIERCREALDGTDPVKLVSMGALFAQRGLLEAALPPLDRAAQLDADDYDSHFNLGLIYFQMKRFRESLKPLAAAVALRPESFDAVALLGSALFASGDDYSALDQLRHAHQLQPANEKIMGLLQRELQIVGQHTASQGDFHQAANLMKEALQLNPDSPELQSVSFRLAKTSFEHSSYEETVHLLTLTKPAVANAPEWHALMGYASYKQGDAATAIVELQRAMDLSPSNQDYVLELSEVLIDSNNPGASATLLETERKAFPDSARILFSLGVSYLADDKLQLAERALRRSLELDPGLDLAYVVLGKGYRDAGRWEDLSGVADRLIHLSPANHLGYFYKAIVLLRSPGSDDKQIEPLLRKSSQLDPGDPEPRYELAKLLERKGEKDTSIEELEKIVALNSDFSQAYYQLYRLYAQKGDLAKSRKAEYIYERLRQRRGQPVRKLLVQIREH